jgi:pimeloyl-ACP methyl ester carboxylesterase
MGNNTPVNKLIFPAPSPPFYNDMHLRLVWIPIKPEAKNSFSTNGSLSGYPEQQISKIKEAIPCLYLPAIRESSKILLYFHGNAEDIGCTEEFLNPLRNQFNFHVLSVEYPGYGLYEGVPTGDKIRANCHVIWETLTQTLKIKPENILLWGRSMGSGPATYMASKFNPLCLMLFAPYTGIKDIAKDYTF